MKTKPKLRLTIRGLTIMEAMIAMVIAFVAFTLLMGTLVSTAQFTENIKENSVGTTLAQTQMDQLLLYAPADITNSNGHYSKPFDNFLYNISLQSNTQTQFSHTATLTVTVTTPGKRTVSLNTLMKDVQLYGLSVVQGSSANNLNAVYLDKTTNTIRHVTGGVAGGFTNTVENVLPGGCKLTSIGGDPMGNMVYGGDAGNMDVFDATMFNGASPSDGPAVSWAPRTNGSSADTPFGRIGGIACTWDVQRGPVELVMVSDRTNHWIDHGWLWSQYNYDWKGHDFPPGPHTLGEPMGIAAGYGGNNTWVGDITNLCLRHSMTNGWWAVWDPTQFRATGMGMPIGVATTPWSDFVFVDDPTNLWVLQPPAATLSSSTVTGNTSNGTWYKIPLPTTLVQAWPSGLSWDNGTGSNYTQPSNPNNATNANGNLWLVDENGGIWIITGLVTGLGTNHGPCPPGCGSCAMPGGGTVGTGVPPMVTFQRVYPTAAGPFLVPPQLMP